MVMFIESTKQCDDDEFAQRHFYLKDTKKPSLFNLGFTDPVTGYSSHFLSYEYIMNTSWI